MRSNVWLLSALLLLNPTLRAQEYTPDANTVLLLHMNETSGSFVSDASSYSNNGTATGTTIIDGKFGKARNFNGTSDYVNIPDNNLLDISGAFTVEAWIRPGTNISSLIVSKWGTQGNKSFFFQYSSNRIQFGVSLTGFDFTASDYEEIGSTRVIPSDARWHHVAGIFSPGQSMRILIDGTEDVVETSNIPASMYASTASVMLGYQAGGHPYYFNGEVDEVRISNIARQPSEFDYPVVTSVFPQQNALNVQASTNITVTFNVPINPATLTGATFIIQGSQTGKHAGTITATGNTAFTFDPSINFKSGEVVSVSITNAIANPDGDNLTHGYHWRFTVDVTAGSGSFALDSTYTGFTYPGRPNAADFDNDGDADLNLGSQTGNYMTILRNDGTGTFGMRQDFPTGNNPAINFVADFDNDGDLDIAVSNSYSDNFSILRNDGSGSFSTIYTSPTLGQQPFEITGADFDGDGDVDIVIAVSNSFLIAVSLNNGNGTFGTPSTYSSGSERSNGVATSDVDGDGDFDILMTATPPNAPTGAYVRVFKNDGSALFTHTGTVSFPNYAYHFAVGDYDADGDEDLAVTHGDFGITIHINNGDGTYTTSSSIAQGLRNSIVRAADINNDGALDLVVGTADTDSIETYENDGTGRFQNRKRYLVPNVNGHEDAHHLAVADLDGNGSIDIVVSNHQNTNTVSILKNALADVTPPSCAITAIIPGPPKQIQVTVQDLQSGLQSVTAVTLINATLNVPSFTIETTSPVVVTATKINQSQSASVTLRVTDVAGNFVVCDPVYTTISAEMPQAFALGANYPNPFNPITTISFELPSSSFVSIKVFDVLGREVATLLREEKEAGKHNVQFDASKLSSGMYFYRIQAANYSAQRKMLLLR